MRGCAKNAPPTLGRCPAGSAYWGGAGGRSGFAVAFEARV